VEIPNGVAVDRFATAEPLDGWPGDGGAVGFLGRFGEPRKGFRVLRGAFAELAAARPGVRLLVAGPGDPDDAVAGLDPRVRERVTLLGAVSERDKARMLRSVDVYAAPNVGGESFGIILTEAMAAGAAIVASDLDAFRRVLDDGRAGVLVPVGDPHALAQGVADLLDDPARRAELSERARRAVAAFDWSTVAKRVVDVYQTTIAATPDAVTGDDTSIDEGLPEQVRDVATATGE
jgi:phosphatidylinositol alpha-mannosyltransferase